MQAEPAAGPDQVLRRLVSSCLVSWPRRMMLDSLDDVDFSSALVPSLFTGCNVIAWLCSGGEGTEQATKAERSLDGAGVRMIQGR